METKHTPGPWEVEELKRHFDQEYLSLHNNFILIGNENNSIAYIPAIHPEAEANAHLIAAAPEMYEALKRLLAAHDADVKHGSLIALGNSAAADQARAAIAKAQGE